MCDKWLQIIIPWLFLLLQVGIKSSQYILSETWPNKADAILSQNIWGGVSGGFHYRLCGRWMNAPQASPILLFHLPNSFSWTSEIFHTMSPIFSKLPTESMTVIKHGVKHLGLVLSTNARNTYDNFVKTFLSSGSVQTKAQPVILPFVVSSWAVVLSLGIRTFWRRRVVASVVKNKTYVKRGRWLRLPSDILMLGYKAELLILLIHDNLIFDYMFTNCFKRILAWFSVPDVLHSHDILNNVQLQSPFSMCGWMAGCFIYWIPF